jgi:outer membrane protein
MRASLALGLLLASAAAMPARADSLRDAFIEAYASNPVLTTARARLQATDEGVPIAKADARLRASTTFGVTQNTSSATTLTNGGRVLTAQLNLSYPLYQGGRVRNAINAAEARVIAGRADLRTTEGTVFTDAVTAYMNVIRDQSIVGLNLKQVDVLTTNLKASRDRFQVGDLTRTDVAQSEARLSIARSQLATAQGNLTSSRETYRRIIGKWPENLEPPPPLPKLPATADEAVGIALDNNASIQSATAATQAAQYDVRTARAARLPTLSATGGTGYNNYLGTRALSVGLPTGTQGLDQEVSQNSVGVSLTLPLYQGGLVGSRVRQAQAVESQTLEQGVNAERQVVANARAAFAIFLAASDAITANEQAVSANTLALEGVRAENSAGTRTVLDVLNAEQELLNSNVLLVTARRDQYVAGFALINAMGRAEAGQLGLDGGTLYNPVAHYSSVRNRLSDWSDSPRPKAQATRTIGPTPSDPDVQPLPPQDDIPTALPPPVTPPRN